MNSTVIPGGGVIPNIHRALLPRYHSWVHPDLSSGAASKEADEVNDLDLYPRPDEFQVHACAECEREAPFWSRHCRACRTVSVELEAGVEGDEPHTPSSAEEVCVLTEQQIEARKEMYGGKERLKEKGFLRFVSLPARAPHGDASYLRMSKMNGCH